MSFLTGLSLEFDIVRTQILFSSELPSLHETFTRVLRTETSQSFQPVANSALISHGKWNEVECQSNSNGNKGGGTNNHDEGVDGRNRELGGMVCYYCHEPGHTKCTCRKLQNKSQRVQSANIVAFDTGAISSSEKTILVSTDEFAQFSQYQASLKFTAPITAIVESGSYDEVDY